MSRMKSSYVISDEVRGRHNESPIVQHDISMNHMESRTVWNGTFWNEVERRRIYGVKQQENGPDHNITPLL